MTQKGRFQFPGTEHLTNPRKAAQERRIQIRVKARAYLERTGNANLIEMLGLPQEFDAE